MSPLSHFQPPRCTREVPFGARCWRLLQFGFALGVLLTSGGSSRALAQSNANVVVKSSAEFAIETWRADNGLPQNSATAVIQTRRGYIWIGTYNGIAQFDGLRFKVFNSSNTKGLANSRVTSLLEDSRGNIWLGHDTGEVTRHADGEFKQIKLPAAWSDAPIKEFAEDERGETWVLNQPGDALRLKDGFISHPPPLMAQNPFVNPRVAKDAQRRPYVARNGVVARLTSAGYELVDFGDPSVRPYYLGLTAARDGQLWLLGEGKVRKWNGTNWTADLGPFPQSDVSITTMLETSSGRLVVGTLQSGLFVHDPASGWSQLDRSNGLPQDWVCTLTEDRERNLWVGTGGGLALLRERKVTMISPPDDWQGRPVYSLTRTHDGGIWATTEGAGVYHFNGTNWTHYGVNEGLANLFAWSVFEDSQQQIWVGTWGGGLFRLEDGRFVVQTNLLPTTDPVVALKESPRGTIWLGTGAGLWRMRAGKMESLAALSGAAAGDVRAIEPGVGGDLWIGTQGSGLGLLRNGQFKSFQTKDGLAGNFILSLCCETNGTLWIGTLDMGLCRYQNGQFRTINTAHGLPANIIYHLEDDQMGNLWFNSPIGIYRISKLQLNTCADGEPTKLDVLAYGKAEGMTTLAGTGGFTPSGFRAPDGRLWLSTTRGIAVVEPKAARPNLVRPQVWVEDVTVDGQSVTVSRNPTNPRTIPGSPAPARSSIVLQPGRHLMDVQFTGLSFTSPERVQFKYQLEGLDAAWTEAGPRRRVTYPFLPPGEYTFRVIACNSDGLWSDSGDSLLIIQQPFFWQTWWFKTFLVVTSIVIIALIFYVESRRRLHRKLERIARERELERERARIAQDIHDDLGASLTRIGMLSQSAAGDLDDVPRATSSLNQIYETARDLTRAMDEIVWAVNPRHDTLDSLMNYIARFAHDFLSAAQIRCRLDAPTQVPELTVRSEVRHNLFLAFKETLNNAVKHSGAKEIQVMFELRPGGLKLIAADNGSGFDPKSKAGPAGDRVISGYGMTGIRNRLEQIGGRVEIISTPGAGTRVELFVPLAGVSQSVWPPATNGG